jgi:hypothetical protein
MDRLIEIRNDGGKIIWSNFWQTEFNERGLFFLSINARTVRLLMPKRRTPAILEMTTAKHIVLTRGRYENKDAVELLFDDGSDQPYGLWIDGGQTDRLWPPSEDGTKLPFLLYGPRIDGATVTSEPFEYWTSTAYLRRAPKLPFMAAWKGKL